MGQENPFIEGFILQAGLILALGAQNIFVLESGLKRQNHLLVALLCSICDVILIAIGVMGAASIFVQVPLLKVIFGVVGVLFLFVYGIKKIKDGFNLKVEPNTPLQTASSKKQVILLTLGFSLLNPHVYLDTIILIGGYSAKFVELERRLQFGAGVGAVSILWFFGISIFAYTMSRFLNNQKGMKFISVAAGLILLVLSFKLGADVYAWRN